MIKQKKKKKKDTREPRHYEHASSLVIVPLGMVLFYFLKI